MLYLVHVLVVFAVFFVGKTVWEGSIMLLIMILSSNNVCKTCLSWAQRFECETTLNFQSLSVGSREYESSKWPKKKLPPIFQGETSQPQPFSKAQPTSQPWIHCFTAPVQPSNSSPESSPGVRGVWCQSLWVSWLKSYGLVCFFLNCCWGTYRIDLI